MSLYTFSSKQKVEFYDCDAMGVVWHGNYIKYLEVARGEFLNLINYSYQQIHKNNYAFPIVDLKLKYTSSLFLGDQFEVITSLDEYENRLVHSFKIKAGDRICLKATSIQVAISFDQHEMEFIMPESFRNAVKNFLKEQNEC